MFKHLFYRIKAFLITLFTPTPEKVVANAVAVLEATVANYEAALDAEADLRLESYNRQFNSSNRESALRVLSDDRADRIRENHGVASYALGLLKDAAL